jgi:hypothetical protein
MNYFKALCLSSGGIKGFYTLGTLHYFYEQNLLNEIRYYIGTSIGSVICLLLIIGYSPIEILSYLCINDINENINFNSVFSNLGEKYGILDIELFENYLENMVIFKLGYIPTFEDLLLKYNKYFICNSLCIPNNQSIKSKGEKIYFNPNDYPKFSVTKAVCMSCSIPFIFSKNIFENNVYIDGAIFDRCPIKKIIEFIDNKEFIKKEEILCIILLDNDNDNNQINELEDIENIIIDKELNLIHTFINKSKLIISKQTQLFWLYITNLFNYFKKIFYYTLFEFEDNFNDERVKYIKLITNNEQLNFNIKSKDKIKMFLNGIEQIKNILYESRVQKGLKKRIKID